MQPQLFNIGATFAGVTYEPALDQKRLTGSAERVFKAMQSGQWLTLRELHAICGGSEAGLSARLRDLRKPAWGSYTVARRRRDCPEKGIFEYRLIK